MLKTVTLKFCNHNCKSFGRHQRSQQAAGWCVMRALDKNVVAEWIAKRVPVRNHESVMGGVGNNLLRICTLFCSMIGPFNYLARVNRKDVLLTAAFSRLYHG